MFLVGSYDIPDDRRRTRLHRDLRGLVCAWHTSVFECGARRARGGASPGVVRYTIKRGEDHVRYYRLCENCVSRVIALGGTITVTFPA